MCCFGAAWGKMHGPVRIGRGWAAMGWSGSGRIGEHWAGLEWPGKIAWSGELGRGQKRIVAAWNDEAPVRRASLRDIITWRRRCSYGTCRLSQRLRRRSDPIPSHGWHRYRCTYLRR